MANIEIFRLENSCGLGIFHTHAVGQEEAPTTHTNKSFPIMDQCIFRYAIANGYLFGCQTAKHLADYFTLDAINFLLSYGSKLFKITIPEEFVVEDKTQCVFDNDKIISKESVAYDDFVEMVNNENCVLN